MFDCTVPGKDAADALDTFVWAEVVDIMMEAVHSILMDR